MAPLQSTILILVGLLYFATATTTCVHCVLPTMVVDKTLVELENITSIVIYSNAKIDLNAQRTANKIVSLNVEKASGPKGCSTINVTSDCKVNNNELICELQFEGMGSQDDNCGDRWNLNVDVPLALSWLENYKVIQPKQMKCYNNNNEEVHCFNTKSTPYVPPHPTVIARNWTDSFTQETYWLNVTIPHCNDLNESSLIELVFGGAENMSSVMFMYQYASRCDYKHCDCSMPAAGQPGENAKVFTASIPYSRVTEKSLHVYVLYTAEGWTTRHQYPIDALPHQFLHFPIQCGLGQDGPCDESYCWIKLGVKGCQSS